MMKKAALNILAFLFRLFPRNRHLWVTGKTTAWGSSNPPPTFFDNSKYFFLYLVNETKEKAYWLSSSDKEIEMLRGMNLPVVRFPSVKGIFLALRAKFFFHHYGTDQIHEALQRGSVQLDFWHGTPLKKIRYDVAEKPPEQHSRFLDWMNRGGIEYVSSTSEYLSREILAGAFDVPKEQLLNFGYPRMDVMALGREENKAFCRKYSPELLPYIEMAEKRDRVFLYMPTFRDDDPAYFEKAAIDYDALNAAMEKINGVFFLKLHPLTKYSAIRKYDRIIQISNDVDIYPFLIYTDCLVTDYSSIFFDYLPLDREIVFIPYDYENYVSHRELYFDYDEITPGRKYKSFRAFIGDLPCTDRPEDAAARKRVRERMIENNHYDACEKTYQFIKEKYQNR